MKKRRVLAIENRMEIDSTTTLTNKEKRENIKKIRERFSDPTFDHEAYRLEREKEDEAIMEHRQKHGVSKEFQKKLDKLDDIRERMGL